MSSINRSRLRRLVIQESYRLSLMQQLYEQAAPTPPAEDPAAAAAAAPPPPPADPALAGPAVDPAAAAPAVDPAAAAAVDPAAAAPAVDPTAAAAATPPPPPPVDPAAAVTPDPAAAAASTPPAGAAPVAAPAPGAPAPSAPAAKPAADGEKETTATSSSEVEKAGQAAITAATGDLATESLRRRNLRFLMEQEAKLPSIDMDVYAGKIANLIKNYTSLVDIKKNVIDQAEKFLDDQFPDKSKDLKDQLKNLLRKQYHISLERQEEPEAPLAVGATKAAGGAG